MNKNDFILNWTNAAYFWVGWFICLVIQKFISPHFLFYLDNILLNLSFLIGCHNFQFVWMICLIVCSIVLDSVIAVGGWLVGRVTVKIKFLFWRLQFDAEFRRFSVSRTVSGSNFVDFYELVERLHCLKEIPFVILYTDEDDDLLPINNNDNYRKALSSTPAVLRVHIQRKGMV